MCEVKWIVTVNGDDDVGVFQAGAFGFLGNLVGDGHAHERGICWRWDIDDFG